MHKLFLLLSVSSILTVWLIAPVVNAGGKMTDDGKDAGFWDSTTIVVYQVQKTEVNDSRIHRLTGEVLAVLNTSKMIPTSVQLLYSDPYFLEKLFSPKAKGIYILCVYEKGGKWYVDDSVLTFFENRCGAQQVTGLQDPALAHFIEKIDALREKARERRTSPDTDH